MSEPTERLTIARLAGIYAGIRLDSQSLNSSKPTTEATEAGETEASESSEVVESAVADSQGCPFPRAIDEIEEDAHAEEFLPGISNFVPLTLLFVLSLPSLRSVGARFFSRQ